MKINPAEYKILVVDDVESNVLLLKTLLGKEGFEVICAIGGGEAIEKVREKRPDLILLDVMMPDMDGFEVAGLLKQEPSYADIPIIFLTALNDSSSVVKGFQSGANDFISSAFRREELLIRVKHQLALVDARRVIMRQAEELRSTIRGRDKLYTVIAHDLRSPMATIKMLCNTIMMNLDSLSVPGDLFEMLELTNKTAEEVFSRLDNLLKWTQIQLDTLSNVPQSIDIVGLVEGVVDLFKPVAGSKSISLAFETATSSVEVTADIEMIKSVICNLLSNAIKYSREHSEVKVLMEVEKATSDSKTGKNVIVTVVDKGCGIKPEEQSKLLNETNRFPSPGTDREEDSGLGLFLCQEFIHRNNGEFWFTSTPDLGSSFSFSLPMK